MCMWAAVCLRSPIIGLRPILKWASLLLKSVADIFPEKALIIFCRFHRLDFFDSLILSTSSPSRSVSAQTLGRKRRQCAAGARRSMEKTPYDSLEETRTSMEEIVAKMLFLKKEGRPKSELRELITQLSMLFVNLRQINRTILLEEDRMKAETERAKAPVDFTTLQLQNLMYEKNHYLKAIKACKDFKSKHPDIELVPEEEFFKSASEEIKERLLAKDPSHDLMLKRLNFELFQRKELCKLHEKLEECKRSLLESIANRKKFLSSIPSHLKSLKKASLPVQQQLGILHTKKLKQLHLAELLPPPLYVIYSQFLAQKEAFGENIDMEIIGSMKEAQTLANQQGTKDTDIGTNTENGRLEDEAPDEEEDVQRRRKRPKKVPGRESLDPSGVYQSHPLKIVLHVYDDEIMDSKPVKLVVLRFEYLLKLNVVCVGIEGSHEGPESNILCNLFPDDTGIELPHQQASCHIFFLHGNDNGGTDVQTAKLRAGDSISFDEKKTSRPYKWAQHLAGIDFLPEVSPLLVASETRSNDGQKVAAVHSGIALYRQQNRVQTVVQRIRSRKKAQLALAEQLDSLLKLKWPALIYKNVPWALHNPTCTLQNWFSLGSIPVQTSSLSPVAAEQIANSLDVDMDGRSAAFRDDVESAREDGELPVVLQAPSLNGSRMPPSKGSDLERSRHLALMSKSMLPGNKRRSPSFKKEDNLVPMLDSESDHEEPLHVEPETENIKISMEYPLRPPLFTLSLSATVPGEPSDTAQGDSVSHEKDGFEWYNELRSMETEINLHILKILPREHEDHILAHQVRGLAMLFDFQIDQAFTSSKSRKSNSVIDIGLCKPVSGRILTRSFRGRDRRKMVSWKDLECTPGYPC
ncbi:hypothetical protein ACLOJK_016551 [Asimina triloba]